MASAARSASRSLPRPARLAQNTAAPSSISPPWATRTSRGQSASQAPTNNGSKFSDLDLPLPPHLTVNRTRSGNAPIKITPTAHSPVPLRGHINNIGRWDERPRAGTEFRTRTARDDNRPPRPLLHHSKHARNPAMKKMGRTDVPSSSGFNKAKRERVQLDNHPMQELAEDSQWTKGSLTSIVEDPHSDRRRKKPAETTGNFRNGSLERSVVSWKDASRTTHHKLHPKTRPKLVEKVSYDVYIPKNITVTNLARLLGIKHKVLQRRMSALGMANTDYDYMLSSDDAYVLALEFDRNPIVDDEAAFDLYPLPLPEDKSSLPLKPPVITIMGHVDHGKTTLLDTLRSTSVASGEAGGITQHIGAFSVPVPYTPNSLSGELSAGSPRTITFLDTPGHAAFSAMRARGASATDIIVLVVAADDGVMPQTREVIELATKDTTDDGSGVGLVVVINKIDKPGANVDAVKQSLLAAGVQLEDFGGDTPCVEVSGLTGLGLDRLVETLSALAEVKELRARATGRAEGRVLESRIDKGRGCVATVLVTQGELVMGSHIIAGTTWARVRQMTDSAGKNVQSVSAGTPVTISGWKMLPNAGDEVLEGKEDEVKSAVQNRKRNCEHLALQADVKSINEKRLEAKAKEAAAEAKAERLRSRSRSRGMPMSPPQPQLQRAEIQNADNELRLIIKADVSGSVEAVVGAIQGVGNRLVKAKIVQSSVGEPCEADIDLAKAIEATLLAFSVKPSSRIVNYAAAAGVPIITNTVIYRLMDEVRLRLQDLLPRVVEHKVLGEATVQQVFDVKGKGKTILKIAGCRVTNGVIERAKSVRVLRSGQEIYSGSLDTLRHVKKDITEARKGSECGMAMDGFSGFQEGDKIQSFEQTERPGQL